jgi:hypothetical protein
MCDDVVSLWLDGQNVADYVVVPHVDLTVAPRPYLHPVRTLAGLTVTDAQPADHRWHLGASLAIPDVSGTNLWGGRTYVRGTGYAWRGDHGRIAHLEFVQRAPDRLVHRLRWHDQDGGTLLEEERSVTARPLPDRPDSWALDIRYRLTAPRDREIVLRSPATNGRPGGAGYGGFFWRAAGPGGAVRVFTASAAREARVNGSAEPWVAVASPHPHPYTLVFTGLPDGGRWFVRSATYPGVCAALAFDRPRVIPAGTCLDGAHTVVVADAVLSPRIAGHVAAAAAGGGGEPASSSGASNPVVSAGPGGHDRGHGVRAERR